MAKEADLAAVRAGEPNAQERLARELWPLAFRVALTVLADRHAAQDAAQEAVIAVLQSAERVRAAEALPSYVRKTAARCAYREFRRARREQPMEISPTSDPSWISDDYLDLRRAVAALCDDDRIPLLLHYGAGMTSGEIGGALGITAAAVRFRLMRCRTRLRAALSYVPEGALSDAAR